MSKRALILFAHGARDPRWAEPFQRLQQLVQSQSSEVIVALSFLELMRPKLPELVAQLAADDCIDVTVVPIFFGQGGHLLRDLPLIVDQLRMDYPAINLRVAGAVGEDATVLAAIAAYCMSTLHAQ
ncbi:MAG: CbiX/SirB N-terminal domain-containing protein [Pseudomonadota bacterium]